MSIFLPATKGIKKTFIAQYRQIFYTVSIGKPKCPSDMIHENVECCELERLGVGNNNPPAYVSNVSYGRVIYIKLETGSESTEVEAAFEASR